MLNNYQEMTKFGRIIVDDEIKRNGGGMHNYYEGYGLSWYEEWYDNSGDSERYLSEEEALSVAEAEGALVCTTSNGKNLFYIQ